MKSDEKYWRIEGQNGRGGIKVFIDALPLDADWDFTAKPHENDRSLAQNRLMRMWATDLSKFLRDDCGVFITQDDLIDEFTERVWGLETYRSPFTNEIKTRHKRTSKAKMRPMWELLQAMSRYASTIGCLLRHPEDLYQEAMGRRKARRARKQTSEVENSGIFHS